jgi:hypothetical protein
MYKSDDIESETGVEGNKYSNRIQEAEMHFLRIVKGCTT